MKAAVSLFVLSLTAFAEDLDTLSLLQTRADEVDDDLLSDVTGEIEEANDENGDDRPLVSPDDCHWDKHCCMFKCNNWKKSQGWYKGMAAFGWDECEIRSMSFKQGELFFNKQASGACGGLGSAKAKCPDRLIGGVSGTIPQQVKRFTQVVSGKLTARDCSKDPVKTYYNDITHDNLQLIRDLKSEIQGMKEREKANQKRMALLTQENKDLMEPLLKKQEEQRELEEKLKSYNKDKMALKNLRAHNKQLEERTSEAKQEYRGTEEKFRKIEKERDDLYRRFQKAVREIQRRAELGKNAILEKKLEVLQTQFDEKQAQLTEVLAAAKLDPSVVASVTKKLEQVLGAKNRQIKDLQYQVHQCTKAYNDTISVYESKLPTLGIDPEEIGFEPIQTATSKMPARLVTRVS